MKNSETLALLLTAQPEDDITAYLLADALMEEREMTRSEATRIVLSVRVAGFDARELAEAAALIRVDSAERSVCLSVIFAACPHAPPRSAAVVLIPGYAPPRATNHYRTGLGGWWYDWTITVGAVWLTTAHAKRVATDAKRAARKPRR